MLPGDPLPLAAESGLGEDGFWHPLHPSTGVPLCDHARGQEPARSLSASKERQPVLSTPRAVRCAPHPVSGLAEDWPAVHWPGFAEFPPVPPKSWPTPRPPKWFIWYVLYPLQNGRCAACHRRAPQSIDHCHDTYLVRGLLCSACNNAENKCWHDPNCFADYYANPPAKPFQWVYPVGCSHGSFRPPVQIRVNGGLVTP
ncbi:endonuclease domain-containing protein [Micromonospora sediminicola]|uniref:endonuclease domain-containing protein n=1 Tax=Micromonospora sediminicola TaxID=946078 RepID=UPI0033EFBC96